MKEEIEKIIEESVRPALNEHEGDLELVDVKDRVAYIKFKGRCSGCPAAQITLEEIVKEELLKNTDLIDDVYLQEETDQELYDLARDILSGKVQLGNN